MLAPESVVAWIIIGGIAGWLAGVLIKGYGFGIVGNIIIGILGAGIAGILAPRLGLYAESTGGNIVAAVIGALILLFLIGLVKRASQASTSIRFCYDYLRRLQLDMSLITPPGCLPSYLDFLGLSFVNSC